MTKSKPRLGEREMDIMQALWRLGQASVADVQAALLADGHEVAYTTVQTMLNRLEAKGRVARDTAERTHRYRSLMKQPTVVGGAIQTLVDRFFGGSVEALATHLVEKNLKEDTLDRLESLINEQRRKGAQ